MVELERGGLSSKAQDPCRLQKVHEVQCAKGTARAWQIQALSGWQKLFLFQTSLEGTYPGPNQPQRDKTVSGCCGGSKGQSQMAVEGRCLKKKNDFLSMLFSSIWVLRFGKKKSQFYKIRKNYKFRVQVMYHPRGRNTSELRFCCQGLTLPLHCLHVKKTN